MWYDENMNKQCNARVKQFSIDSTVSRRAVLVFRGLMRRSDNDRDRVRGIAMSYRSWCSRKFGSRRRSGALWNMWSKVAEMCKAGDNLTGG